MDKTLVTQVVNELASTFTIAYRDMIEIVKTHNNHTKKSAETELKHTAAVSQQFLNQFGEKLDELGATPEYKQFAKLANSPPHSKDVTPREIAQWHKNLLEILETIDQVYGTGEATVRNAA